MSIIIGDPEYIPNLLGVFIDYPVSINAVAGKNVVLQATCDNLNYKCVEKVSDLASTTFTGTQTKTYRVSVQNRSNLLPGTDIQFLVTSTDSGSGYTVGANTILGVADRVPVYLDCNGITVKYNVPVSDTSTPLVGVMNNGDEYYVVPHITSASYSNRLPNSIYGLVADLRVLPPTNEINLSKVCTSRITNMEWLFYALTISHHLYLFVSSWDTSNVTSLRSTFLGSFFNQSIAKWNTSKVTNMFETFKNCPYFNQNISEWDTSNVTNMQGMFHSASAFASNISEWNVKNVTNMAFMFYGATSVGQNFIKWNSRQVTDYLNISVFGSGGVPNLSHLGSFDFYVEITYPETRYMTEEEFQITFTFNVAPVLFNTSKFTAQSLVITNFAQDPMDSRIFTCDAKSTPGFKGIAKIIIDAGDVVDSLARTTIDRVERFYIGCPVVHVGTGVPSDLIDADYYYDLSTGDFYGPKTAGTWTGTLVGNLNDNDPNSNLVLFGDGNPSSFLGENGSYYINTSTGEFFGPKTGGSWGSGTPLSGGPPPGGVPVITSASGALPNYPSGGTGQVYQATATGGSIVYTLGGDDAGDFTITPSGTLFFASPPNFSSPTDANADNVYLVDVIATNGFGSDTVSLSITVTGGPPSIVSVSVSSFYPGVTAMIGKINVDVTMNKSGLTPSVSLTPTSTTPGFTATVFSLLSGNTFRSTVTPPDGFSSTAIIRVPSLTFTDTNSVSNSDQAFTTVNFDLPTIRLSGPNSVLSSSSNTYQVKLSSPYPYNVSLPYLLTLNPGTVTANFSFTGLSTSGTLVFAPADLSLTKTLTIDVQPSSGGKGGTISLPTTPSNIQSMTGSPLAVIVIADPPSPPVAPPVFTSSPNSSVTVPPGSSSNTTPVYTPTVQGGNAGVVYAIKPDSLPADDAELFDIDAGTGLITLRDPIATNGSLPPDADSNGVYEIIVIATNSLGSTEFPVQIILFLSSVSSGDSQEPGFVGGNYSIEFVYPEFTAKSTNNVVITRNNFIHSKLVQEDLLFLIRDLIVGQMDETSVYEFPSDAPLSRPFLFYDHSGATTPTSDALKLYLNKNNTVSSGVASIIDKIVKVVFTPGEKFMKYFFTSNISNGKINRLGFRFSSKIFGGTITLSSSPSRIEV